MGGERNRPIKPIVKGELVAEQKISITMNVEGKNLIIAYLLWWFLGWAGVHRMYLGRFGTGLAQLVLFIIGLVTMILIVGYLFLAVVGVWWLLDAYLTYKIVIEENSKLGVEASSFSFSKIGGIHNELDHLEKLHLLYEKGILTKEQYENKKAKLL